ncbi:hypothetical protein LUZ60_013869 [Juncus effusus]|nr:hypothetical protein LUZ60_013869 [Juncus effusus]
MKITELGEVNSEEEESTERQIVPIGAKRVLVGAGARVLFYPTLLYNVVRNKMQSEFRWWDEIDQFILLGAVPFPSDVPRLKMQGVHGVVTLNEPYETLVPSSLYQAHGIEHLVIPTRDYLFAPCHRDINLAVDFIHRNAIEGRKTYVHCKAGRGRSTTIVLCYLVKYKNMRAEDAFEYIRSIRPRVLLARSQWKAVKSYSKQTQNPSLYPDSLSDDPVFVTEADLEGYYKYNSSKGLSVISTSLRVRHAKRPTIAMLACLFASLGLSATGPHLVRDPLPQVSAC